MATEKEPNFFLWTVQIAQWKKVKQPGMRLLDITVKSGVKAFAPDWDNLKLYKAGQMSEEEYTERYVDKMYETQQTERYLWDHLSVYPHVAYACYCASGVFCHRHVFARLAKGHLERMGWVPKLMGEFTGDLQGVVIPEWFIRVEQELAFAKRTFTA